MFKVGCVLRHANDYTFFFLLLQGLEQLAQEEREDEQSPLKEALESCMVDFARFLVEAGCDLSSQSYLFNCKSK